MYWSTDGQQSSNTLSDSVSASHIIGRLMNTIVHI